MNMIVYFACSEAMFKKAQERSGASRGDPSLFLPHADYTSYMKAMPYEGFIFHHNRRDALDHAIESKYKYVFEALFDERVCAAALTASLESDTQELEFAVKELLTLSHINGEVVTG